MRLINERYGVDMGLTQHPKLIADLPKVDIVVTMGCGVECPYLPAERREDWGLEDPTGKGDEAFGSVIDAIERNILALKASLQ